MTIEIAGRAVTVTNPAKVFFGSAGITKLDLVRYYASVAEGALRGISGRPIVLKRYVNGTDEEPFFQKRAPPSRPSWLGKDLARPSAAGDAAASPAPRLPTSW